jgi:TIR domain
MVEAVSGRLLIKKMADAGVTEPAKLKVYISYARKDEDFAQELRGGLVLAGFKAYPDKHDIAAEDWRDRLGSLIEAADTVVFVISPDAVASERCAWELERTVLLNKRLLPIVWRPVEEAQVPPHLRQLNSIFFDRPLTFIPSLKALNCALETDSAWVQEHTRIAEAALKWKGRGRAEALLLRGEELTAAKSWLASQPKNTPDPTPLHHEFVKAAEDAEAARGLAERQSAVALEPEKSKQGAREARGKRVGIAPRIRARRCRRSVSMHHRWRDRMVQSGAISMAHSYAPSRPHCRAGEAEIGDARFRLQGVCPRLPDDDRSTCRQVHYGITGDRERS